MRMCEKESYSLSKLSYLLLELLQTDFGMLNIIMTLRGEGGLAHDVGKFLIKYLCGKQPGIEKVA